MRTYKLGECLHFPEHDGIYRKQITKILWRENNRGTVYFEKDEILEPALSWCIVLFDTGEWLNGNELPKNLKSN